MMIRFYGQKPSKKLQSLFLLWGITAISCLAVFSHFLSGNPLVVFTDVGADTKEQYLMQYATIANHIRLGNLSFWDWNNGFGSSMLALNLFHPFLMLVYLTGALFGTKYIAGSLLFLIILEIFLAATFCYFFLDCFSLSETAKVIASYIYGLNAFLLVWGQHYQFGAPVVFLPILLLCLERAIRKRRFSLSVPLMTAVMVCTSIYTSYMALILAGCYLIFRLAQADGPVKERFGQFVCHCLSLLLGLGISMAVFLPSASYLLSVSSRLESDRSLIQRFLENLKPFHYTFYRTMALRFFSSTFQGIREYKGFSNFYEDPMLYFSALFPFLAFQYLACIPKQDTSRKSKAIQYTAVGFFLFALLIPAGTSIFNAFAYPFARHTFLFMPLFAMVTAFMLDQIWLRKSFSIPAFLLSCLCTAAAHIYPLVCRQVTEANLRRNVVLLLFSSIAAAVLLLLGRKKQALRSRRICSLLLLLFIAAGMSLEGRACFSNRDTLTADNKEYWDGLYDPDVREALNYLEDTDPSFYRVEKDYCSGSFCYDSMEQGYRGISAYNSTPNGNIKQFVETVTPNLPVMEQYQYAYRQIGWYTDHSSLFGIKYLLSKKPDLEVPGFSFLKQFGDVCVYQNSQVSSIARFYTRIGDSSVLADSFGTLNLERMLLEYALLEPDSDKTSAVLDNLHLDMVSAGDLSQKYRLEEIPMVAAEPVVSGDSAVISLDRSILDDYHNVYLEFDIRSPKGCDITVNPQDSFEYHFRVQKNVKKHVQTAIPPSWDSVTLTRYGSADFSGTISNIRLLGSREIPETDPNAVITLDNTNTDSRLTGTITAKADGLLFLPIPFEKGWTACVDGVQTDILQTDIGFVSIPVTEGSHTYSFQYRVPYMKPGILISLLFLSLWTGLLAFRIQRRNKQ